ncbi:hypothetical protein D7207_37240 [Burkholderia cepacia]|nr:hypothetical protein [Burkholderia cepacia]MBA9943316.1 hypothetical protein [Burkholderia cepacia]MBA9979256.1 hypothetical protein [Burkholderia cepacia]MBA9998041.1 hypothetical protein [Burkholderia cepacia]MBA9999815.1 hypothetical protein [Burkholderia cepacia]
MTPVARGCTAKHGARAGRRAPDAGRRTPGAGFATPTTAPKHRKRRKRPAKQARIAVARRAIPAGHRLH